MYVTTIRAWSRPFVSFSEFQCILQHFLEGGYCRRFSNGVLRSKSIKTIQEEIKTGSLVSLPRELTFDAWSVAWSKACTGIKCEGLKPYFWNSIFIAIPAVII